MACGPACSGGLPPPKIVPLSVLSFSTFCASCSEEHRLATAIASRRQVRHIFDVAKGLGSNLNVENGKRDIGRHILYIHGHSIGNSIVTVASYDCYESLGIWKCRLDAAGYERELDNRSWRQAVQHVYRWSQQPFMHHLPQALSLRVEWNIGGLPWPLDGCSTRCPVCCGGHNAGLHGSD